MNIVKNQKGISRILVLVAAVALALIVVIIIRVVMIKTEQVLEDMDSQIVIAAEHKAKLEYTANDSLREAVYDNENKVFVDPMEARTTIEPYGSSKKHKGKYLLVTIDAGENVSSEWITPY